MKRILLLAIAVFVAANIFAQSNKKSIAHKILQSRQVDLKLSDADIQEARIVDMYQSKHNGVTHVFYNQYHKGIPVYNAILNLNITDRDELLFYGNTFVEDLADKVNSSKSLVTAEDAIRHSGELLGYNEVGKISQLKSTDKYGYVEYAELNYTDGPLRVRKVFYPIGDDVRLAWEIYFRTSGSDDSWNNRIDAVTGQLIDRENMTVYCNHVAGKYHNHTAECRKEDQSSFEKSTSLNAAMGASYRVYPIPVESPIHGSQELVVDPHDTIASPFGWHDIDGIEGPEFTITRGNNVHAYNDGNNDNQSANDEPDGGPELIFDFVHDTAAEPDFNQEADVVNLFYANNIIHDITYHMGFDPPAGNFQNNNYGEDGLDSDFVIAHSLDGSGVNNANFALAPDGVNGNMNMFRWSIPQSRLFSVTEPMELDKQYLNGAAGDGWGFDETYSTVDIEAELAPAYDSDPQFANNVCGPVANADEIEGKIAMIYRGRCEFGTKSLNAQNAGAVAVIICNVPGAGNDPTSDGNDPISNGMGAGANGASVTIPVFALGFEDCNRIVATIEAGTPVVGRIKSEDTGGPAEVSSGMDNVIIFHEYGHGISSRLTGGPGQICLGSDEQMGEGWSDFFALALTVEPGDRGEDARGIGTYVEGEGTDGRGIRRFPYSTDMTINPQTFKDIKATTAPHPLGEVWVDMLWDIFWKYVDKYGYDADWTNSESGNFRAVQLVLDGLKMQGCNPGFIRGRDAILAAERANTNGENQCMIWEVFARRGLGFFADGGSANNRNDGIEDFNPLPECLKTLKIYKEIPGLVETDAEIEVQLIVANHIDSTEYNLMVTDNIPEGLSFVEGSASREVVLQGDQLMFPYDSLASQQWDTITYSLLNDNTVKSAIIEPNAVESPDEIDAWQRVLIEDEINIFRLNSNSIFPTYSGESCWFVQEIDEDTEAMIRFDNIEVVGEKPVVRFWHRINTEFARNGGFVELSTDGVLWHDAKDRFIRNGYDCPLAFTTFAIPGLKAFSGRTDEDEYIDSYIDLSEFKGMTVSLRFRFGTFNNGTDNDETLPVDGGWFIDDLDLIDLVIDETEACISNENNQACTESAMTVLDPQLISNTEDVDFSVAGVIVYPNPADQFINVVFESPGSENIRAEIIDIQGRRVISENRNVNTGRNQFVLNTEVLQSGIYLLRIHSGFGLYTRKIIVE